MSSMVRSDASSSSSSTAKMGSKGSSLGRPPGGDFAGDWPGRRGVKVAGVAGGGIAPGVPSTVPPGVVSRPLGLWGDRGDVMCRGRAVGLVGAPLAEDEEGSSKRALVGEATERCMSLASLSSVR